MRPSIAITEDSRTAGSPVCVLIRLIEDNKLSFGLECGNQSHSTTRRDFVFVFSCPACLFAVEAITNNFISLRCSSAFDRSLRSRLVSTDKSESEMRPFDKKARVSKEKSSPALVTSLDMINVSSFAAQLSVFRVFALAARAGETRTWLSRPPSTFLPRLHQNWEISKMKSTCERLRSTANGIRFLVRMSKFG